MSGESFLSRWSKRKAASLAAEADDKPVTEKTDAALPASSAPPDELPAAAGADAPATPPHTPLPDIDSLTPEADFSPFMQRDVAPDLRNRAMKKLFADPHYNVMDRLDIYIDDYTQSDPIPLDVLKKMHQSRALFLFADAEETAPLPGDTPSGDSSWSGDAEQPLADERSVGGGASAMPGETATAKAAPTSAEDAGSEAASLPLTGSVAASGKAPIPK
jgi:hypothetical protein